MDKFFEGDAELARGDAELGRGGNELAQLLLTYTGAPHPRAAAWPLAPRHPSADSREQAAGAEEEAAEAELGYGAGVTSQDELAPEVAADSGDEMLIDAAAVTAAADANSTATADADADATTDAAAAATADATADADANAPPPPSAGTKRAASSVSLLELPAASRARTEEAAEAEAAEAAGAEAAEAAEAEAAEMQVDEAAGMPRPSMPRPGTTQPTLVPAEKSCPGAHPTMQTPQGQRLQRVVQTYTVSVPAGVGPGQQFQAYLGGELADVIVPHGARPCATLHVQMPRSVHKYAVS